MRSMMLFLVMVAGMFSEVNTNKGENDYNKDFKDILCDVYMAAKGILSNAGITDEAMQKDVKDAVYGNNKKNAQIKYSGHVEKASLCGNSFHGRGFLCKYKRGGGCLSQSVLGTFLCVCTPGLGSANDKLCGVNLSEYGGQTWSGGWRDNDVLDKTQLFKKVLDNIKYNCTQENGNSQNQLDELGKLEKAVQKIREKVQRGTFGDIYFYLGGIGGGCDGKGVNDVCAAYEGNEKTTVSVKIPWLEKIQEALKTVKPHFKNRRAQTMSKTFPSGNASLQPGTGAARDAENQKELVELPTPTQDEPLVNKKNESETPTPEKKALARTENNKTFRYTNSIPYLAKDINEDNAKITMPKWILQGFILN
ncbi:Variant surface glycoprotein [Trypanosoma congolense IL3000]|uniref:Variant surface glycoprotein n=1 Tax=Trypanosoma congolense (strain IL3000) TaxID=1068625 RepID=F9W745_TRYCI|nr:Variant surface glycoprotein [Trypanosoma congolense IL3000]